MLSSIRSAALACCAIAVVATSQRSAYAVDPTPLQNAYWRFEEGAANSFVPAATPGDEEFGVIRDTVLDSVLAGKSGNENHMQAYNTDTAPKYVNHSLPPKPLKSGLANTMAFEVDGSSTGGRDVYTHLSEIQNGVFDRTTPTAPGIPAVTGFTLEASFAVYDYSSFRSIIAKEGRPGLEMETGDDNFQALPTLALKVRGSQFEADPNAGKLQIEMFDGAGNLVSIMTDTVLDVGEWYSAAVVNNGETMSLYLDSNDDNGYVLMGQTAVDGVLFQGLDYANGSWDKNWTIGRAVYGGFEDNGVTPFANGRPSDWFNGLIDEVRLSNSVLDPTDFLFYEEPTGLAGDFNGDNRVDGNDFLVWQRGFGSPYDADDLADWKANFGQGTGISAIPEPTSLGLAVAGLGLAITIRRRGC